MSDNQPGAPQTVGQQAPTYGRGQHNQHGAPARHQYTPAEIQAMKDCRSESFWYRSLPLMIGGALLSKYLINRGVLTVRYGALPKMIAGGAVGYFAGIYSYIGKCKEKILKLENSPLADMLRQRKAGVPNPMLAAPGTDPSASSEFGGVQVSGLSDDAHVNMDIDTSNVKRIDDYQDHEQLQLEEQPEEAKPQMTNTYQDLRNKNRSPQPQRPVYQPQQQQQQPQPGAPPRGSYQWQQPSSTPARSPPQRKSQEDEEFPLGRKSGKNKYGDEWE